MSAPTLALQMPEPLYLRLQRLAVLTHRPVESLVIQALEAQIPPLLEDMPAPASITASATFGHSAQDA